MLRLALNAVRRGWPAIRDLLWRAAEALGETGPDRPSMPGKFWKAMTRVRSPSIDALAVRPSPGTIIRHDLVMFQLRHPLAGRLPVNVTKYALCLPGDDLASFTLRSERFPGRTEAAFFCNGILLGVSKAYGRQGQRLDYFPWKSGPIPEGQAYIGSSYKDGFDSRYFGLVPIAKLVRMERVL